MLLLPAMMQNIWKHTKLFSIFLILSLVTSEAKLSRSIPDLDLSDWSKLDLEFGNKVSHIHHGVAQDEIHTSEGIFEYTKSLVDFLESKPEFIDEKTEYYKHKPPQTVEEARKQKNRLRKIKNRPGASDEDRKNFHDALRYYCFLLKQKHKKDNFQRTKSHEKMYRKDFKSLLVKPVMVQLMTQT